MLSQRRRHPVRHLLLLACPQFPRRRVRPFQHFACHANRPRLFRQVEQRNIQPLAIPARRNPHAFVLHRPQRMGARAPLFNRQHVPVRQQLQREVVILRQLAAHHQR